MKSRSVADLHVIRHRLGAQLISASSMRQPESVVAWMGAMQAQDFAAAKWAVGLRAPGITEADVDQAFDAGRILRTHVLRPTWHFVAPRDIRWMLSISAPRVHAVIAQYYRNTGGDPSALATSRRVIERALGRGEALTRAELADRLAHAGIRAAGQQLACLTMHAELDGVICSGPRRGKQFTYMLLDARVPAVAALDREAALAELGRRYFTSHGPATVRDFVWWSGLTVRDAKAALSLISARRVDTSRLTYWMLDSSPDATRRRPTLDLLPIYDEYLIAYQDRDVIDASPGRMRAARSGDPFGHFLMIGGRLAGSWQRTDRGATVLLVVRPYGGLGRSRRATLKAAVDRLQQFSGRMTSTSIE